MWGRIVGLALVAAVAGYVGTADAQAPLKIGFLGELSGSLGSTGSSQRAGFLLYLKLHDNKLGGRPVTVVTEDTAGDPATAIGKAKKLVESDKIDALVGPVSSASGAAIRDYLIDQHMPVLIGSTVDDVLDGKYIFRTTFSGDSEGYLDGYLAGTAGHKRAIAIAPNYSAGQTSVANVEKGFQATGGVMVQKLFPRLGMADFASVIGQFDTSADVAIVFLPGADGVRFIKQYADYGKPLPLHGPSATVDEASLPAEGKAAEGFIGSSPYFSTIDTPENKIFAKAFFEETKNMPSWPAAAGYISGQLLDAALTKLGGKSDDREALVAALKATDIATPEGRFRYDAMNNPISPRYAMQIREIDGVMKPVIFGIIPEYPRGTVKPDLPANLTFPKAAK